MNHIVDKGTFYLAILPKQLSFEHFWPLKIFYVKADIAGYEGLLECVEKLQDAARLAMSRRSLRIAIPMIKNLPALYGQHRGITFLSAGLFLTRPPAVIEESRSTVTR